MIKGVGHIGICVTDLEAALDEFCAALELPRPSTLDYPKQGIKVALVPMGAVCLELIEDYGGKSILTADIKRKGDHIHHFCLVSDDVEHDFGALQEKGAKMRTDQPVVGLRGKKMAFISSGVLAGISIEISGN